MLLYQAYSGADMLGPARVQTLSERELEKLTRRFVQKCRDIIGPLEDIPAPDM